MLKAHRQYVDQVIGTTAADKLTVDHIIDVIKGDMYLDKFQDLLGQLDFLFYVIFRETMKGEDEGISRTYLLGFLNAVTPETFPKLLQLFHCSKSRLVHAKVYMFVNYVIFTAISLCF